MKQVIDTIDKFLLTQELTADKFIRHTNKGGNEIYSFSFHDSPHLMLEVARLREVSFRAAGGGTGGMLDIDAYDTGNIPYRQLIIWNPREQEIAGGYRYFLGYQKVNDTQGKITLVTNTLFYFSEQFTRNYLPYSIELGCAFVQPVYQSAELGTNSIYVLDNLWESLCALEEIYPNVLYFFGKVTTNRNFNPLARNIILRFLQTYFPDDQNLFEPVNPLKIDLETDELKNLFLGINYDEDYRFLVQKLRHLGENLPPLVRAYINLSPNMKVLGTSVNHNFGDVDETAILISMNGIHHNKNLGLMEKKSPLVMEKV